MLGCDCDTKIDCINDDEKINNFPDEKKTQACLDLLKDLGDFDYKSHGIEYNPLTLVNQNDSDI